MDMASNHDRGHENQRKSNKKSNNTTGGLSLSRYLQQQRQAFQITKKALKCKIVGRASILP